MENKKWFEITNQMSKYGDYGTGNGRDWGLLG
jgi:hypothetical protein